VDISKQENKDEKIVENKSVETETINDTKDDKIPDWLK